MATSESDFLIRIKTALEDAGIKATEQQLKDVADSMEDVGKKGEAAHEKIKEGAHKSELSHHELRESVHALAAQFEGLADVGLWLNPLTAGLAATLFIVDKIKESLAEAKEKAELLADAANRIDEARMKGFTQSVNDAAEAMQALAIEQQKLNTAYAEGTTAMDNRLKIYDQEKDAVIKVSEAKLQAFEAEMHYLVEIGKVSKENADAAIAQAKLKLDSQRGAADSDKLQEEINERQQEFDKARFRAANSDEKTIKDRLADEAPLKGSADASAEAVSVAESSKFSAKYKSPLGGVLDFFGTLEELKKMIAAERDKVTESKTKGDTSGANSHQSNVNQLQQVADAREKTLETLRAQAESDKQALIAAKAQTAEAIEQQKHDQEILRTGQAQIETLQKQLDLQKQVTAEVQAQHAAAAATNAKTEAHQQAEHEQSEYARGLVSRARDVESQMHNAGPQAREAYMQELHGLLNSIGSMTADNADQMRVLRDDLNEIRRTVEQAESANKANRYGP